MGNSPTPASLAKLRAVVPQLPTAWVSLGKQTWVTFPARRSWERSTVWGMLRNPAYRGTACYGKTELRPRQRVTRPLRQRKALPSCDVGGHERPRAEWIEIPVPALVSEEIFALAQEQLEKNQRHSPRRTVEPTLLQSMLVCEQCGYGLYRTSTHTTKQKLNYYRCIGSDGYRRLNWPVCTNRPIRRDYLDTFVWSEIIRLLEDPGLIQTEIDRRRDRTKGRPLAQARRGIAPGTSSSGEEQRTPGDGLPRGIADSSPTTTKDATIAETNTGRRIGITISKDGSSG